MTSTIDEQIPAELIEKWSSYIDPSRMASFRQTCAGANVQTIDTATRPFFATWKTSLLGSDLDILKSISTDSLLCNLLDTIIIQDDSDRLDSWAATELPIIGSQYNIWPRDSAGLMSTSQIGLADLTQMLREKSLQPQTIIIRDYQIQKTTLKYGPELAYLQELINKRAPSGQNPATAAVMAKDLVESANPTITSLAICFADHGDHEVSAQFQEKFTDWSLSNPHIRETVIGLSYSDGIDDCEKQAPDVSMVRSAKLSLEQSATAYWPEKIFYEAVALENLQLSLIGRQPLTELVPSMVIPKLKELCLHWTFTPASQILAMLTSSKESLTCLSLCQAHLTDGAWHELLPSIASDFPALASFELRIFREEAKGAPALDFRNVDKELHIPEECQAGLILDRRGPPDNKRVTRLSYNGPEAGRVLEILASHSFIADKLY